MLKLKCLSEIEASPSQTILRNILLECSKRNLMKSINFVIVGDYQIVSELGKKGTTTDLSIYDRKTQDTIYTWTVPITFPDKIDNVYTILVSKAADGDCPYRPTLKSQYGNLP